MLQMEADQYKDKTKKIRKKNIVGFKIKFLFTPDLSLINNMTNSFCQYQNPENKIHKKYNNSLTSAVHFYNLFLFINLLTYRAILVCA